MLQDDDPPRTSSSTKVYSYSTPERPSLTSEPLEDSPVVPPRVAEGRPSHIFVQEDGRDKERQHREKFSTEWAKNEPLTQTGGARVSRASKSLMAASRNLNRQRLPWIGSGKKTRLQHIPRLSDGKRVKIREHTRRRWTSMSSR